MLSLVGGGWCYLAQHVKVCVSLLLHEGKHFVQGCRSIARGTVISGRVIDIGASTGVLNLQSHAKTTQE